MKIKNRVVAVSLSALLLLSPFAYVGCSKEPSETHEILLNGQDKGFVSDHDICFEKIGAENIIAIKFKYEEKEYEHYFYSFYSISEKDYNNFTTGLTENYTHFNNLSVEKQIEIRDIISNYVPQNTTDCQKDTKINMSNYYASDENQK